MNDYKEKILLENTETIKAVVRKLVKGFGIDKEKYEDCLQEAYISVYKNANKYNPEKKFVNFAYPIIKISLINMYRKDKERKLEKVYLNDTISDDGDADRTELADMLISNADTENEVLKKISETMVHDYISKLKGECSAKTTVKGFEALELKIAGYSG